MSTEMRRALVAAAILAAAGPTAEASHNTQLAATLSGPAINGATPSGQARVDQQQLPGKLDVRVENVNLPDGTRAEVYLGGTLAGGAAISGRRFELRTTVSYFVPQFTTVEIRVGATVIASGVLRAR